MGISSHNKLQIAPYFRQDFVANIISDGSRQESTREIALWAQVKRDELLR